MPYQVNSENEVFLNKELVGTFENGLLKLDLYHSNEEWLQVKAYFENNKCFNGKMSRKLTGFHHSYEVIEGQLYRCDHSFIPNYGSYQGEDYVERGYLGSGARSNAKKVYNEFGEQFVKKITGLSESDYRNLIFNQSSLEHNTLIQLGEDAKEYVRPVTSYKIWRKDHPQIAYKKILLTRKKIGEDSFILINKHLTKPSGLLSQIQEYYFAILFLMTNARLFYSGIIHGDVKPENCIIDVENLICNFIDFEGVIFLNQGKDYCKTEFRHGTKDFTAPEVPLGWGKIGLYSEYSEIYSCGVSLVDLFNNDKVAKKYIINRLCPEYNNESISSTRKRAKIIIDRDNFQEAIAFFKAQLSQYLYLSIMTKECKVQNGIYKDEDKVNFLIELALDYRLIDYNKSIAYLKQALLLEKSNSEQEKIRVLITLFTFRHAEELSVNPNYTLGLKNAIDLLEQHCQYIELVSGKENITKLKESTDFKIRSFYRLYWLERSRQHFINHEFNHGSLAFYHASKYAIDLSDHIALLEQAELYSDRNLKIKCVLKLLDAWNEKIAMYEYYNEPLMKINAKHQYEILNNKYNELCEKNHEHSRKPLINLFEKLRIRKNASDKNSNKSDKSSNKKFRRA